jgi:hypothetical protein
VEVHVHSRLLFAGHGDLFRGVENPIPACVTESQALPLSGGVRLTDTHEHNMIEETLRCSRAAKVFEGSASLGRLVSTAAVHRSLPGSGPSA